MIESTIAVGSAENLILLLGTKDQHLKQIRSEIPANISTRDGKILVQGDEQAVIKATAVLEELRSRLREKRYAQRRRRVAGDSPRHQR